MICSEVSVGDLHLAPLRKCEIRLQAARFDTAKHFAAGTSLSGAKGRGEEALVQPFRAVRSLKGNRKNESQSKPGFEVVDPEPGKELRRQPQLFMVGIVPY